MKLQGSHHLAASTEVVWAFLQDPVRLQACIPGCQRLELVGPDHYLAEAELTVAGIKGRYEGELTITDRKPGVGYVLWVKGEGAPGMVDGRVLVSLADDGTGTLMSYDGEVDVGGRVARVGQRVLGGVSKMLIGQFIRCLGSKL